MPAKSIASFFSKPAAKKPTEEVKDEGKENRAITKDPTSGAAERDAKSEAKQKSKKDETVKEKQEGAKENSSNGANIAEAAGGPLALDSEGLPPLRKTKVNPAFKRKAEEKKETPKKVTKKTEAKQTEAAKVEVKEEKAEEEEAVKKVEVKEDEDAEDMEVDSPVKSTKKKKKKAVIDSDSEEEVKENVKSDIKKKKSPVKKESTEKRKGSPLKEESPKSKKESVKGKPQDKSEAEKPKTSPKKSEQKAVNSFFTPKTTKAKSKTAVKEEKDAEDETAEKEDKKAEETPDKKETAKGKDAFASFFKSKPGGAKRNEGGADFETVVVRPSYHPIEASFWGRGEPTPYLALAKTLEAIEATSGRLRTIEILSNYFRSVMVQTPADLLPSVYMTLNRLAPAWEGVELGIGETLLMKAIAASTGRSAAQVKADAGRLGDLGLVAEQSRGGQRTMFQPAILTVGGVFARLREVAELTGHSCGAKKVEKIQALLVACRGSEARYLIRTLAGKLRIGLAEQSVLAALAQAVVQTPVGQEYPPATHTAFKTTEGEKFKEELGRESLKLKTAYCECPSYDLVLPALLEAGIAGLGSRCRLTPGLPLKPMLAHPTKGVQEVLTRFENCRFTCEWKYDGERAQVHLHEDGTINIFSRNQEDNTSKFPDILARLKNCLTEGVSSAVLDCEAVAWDREKKTIQPFQVLSTRKRKDAVEEEIKVQVCVFAFDLLYLNGRSLVTLPFEERRAELRRSFKAVEGEFQFAQSMDGNTVEAIQEALEESIRDNCEGLMVKTLDVDATYEIARRSHNWLKLKKDYLEGVGDTLDLVVLGGYLGKGKRAGKYGGFLLACYEPENEEYQSICKIGTGFTDEDLATHAAFYKDKVVEKPKAYYSFDPTLAPDHWFEACQVWEVKCADLSISPVHRAATGIVDPARGVSLRFPRFIRIREDKKLEDATQAEQIAEMYNNQDVIKNQKEGGKKDKKVAEDDFDF